MFDTLITLALRQRVFIILSALLVLGYGMAESARIPELVDRLGLASESLEKTGHQPGH